MKFPQKSVRGNADAGVFPSRPSRTATVFAGISLWQSILLRICAKLLLKPFTSASDGAKGFMQLQRMVHPVRDAVCNITSSKSLLCPFRTSSALRQRKKPFELQALHAGKVLPEIHFPSFLRNAYSLPQIPFCFRIRHLYSAKLFRLLF